MVKGEKKSGKVQVTLIKSTIGEIQSVKDTVAALGLRKIRSVKTFADSPALQGQLRKVAHLVKIENV